MSVMIDGAEALLVDRKSEVVDYSNKNLHNYPVVIKCTLTKDERAEASDIITATLENTGWGPTKIATQIKMAYDKSFGAAWQVIVGESFSCSIDHELPSLLYMYSGSLCIVAWKCGSILLKEIKYITDEKDEKKKKAALGRKKIT